MEFEPLLGSFEMLFRARGMTLAHGRVFGTLFLSEKALTQQELAEKTGYSVPAVSVALDDLVKVGLAGFAREKGIRKTLYQTESDLVSVFQKFIQGIHDNYVLPFIVTLDSYDRKNPKIPELKQSVENLKLYLEKIGEVKV